MRAGWREPFASPQPSASSSCRTCSPYIPCILIAGHLVTQQKTVDPITDHPCVLPDTSPRCCCLRLLRVDSEATGRINAAQLKELFWRLLNREMTDQEVDAIMNSHQKISNREFTLQTGFPKGCCWVGGSGTGLCTLKATPG